MNISDEAVEAAVDALLGSTLGNRHGINGEEFVEAARAALEAAAPHMFIAARLTDPGATIEQIKRGQKVLAVLLAEAWARGEDSGRSYAMRVMSDEPKAPRPTNPYRSAGAGESDG